MQDAIDKMKQQYRVDSDDDIAKKVVFVHKLNDTEKEKLDMLTGLKNEMKGELSESSMHAKITSQGYRVKNLMEDCEELMSKHRCYHYNFWCEVQIRLDYFGSMQYCNKEYEVFAFEEDQ